MTPRRDPDRLIRAFLMEGETELADPVYDAVRDRIETTQQRTFIGPWRTPDMNRYLKIGLAAAAVVVIAVVGFNLLPGSSGPGPGAGSTATPGPSIAESSPPSPPPLTQTFTSTVHGISVSYPEGWIVLAATEPWTGCLYCSHVHSAPQVDVLHDTIEGGDALFLRIASQPIGESAPEDWVAAQMASWDVCTTTEPIVVDGATGLGGGETCLVAVVTTAGRGYHIDLYVWPGDLDLVAQYDRAWFEEILATVQLHPEDAVDSGASPSP